MHVPKIYAPNQEPAKRWDPRSAGPGGFYGYQGSPGSKGPLRTLMEKAKTFIQVTEELSTSVLNFVKIIFLYARGKYLLRPKPPADILSDLRGDTSERS